MLKNLSNNFAIWLEQKCTKLGDLVEDTVASILVVAWNEI